MVKCSKKSKSKTKKISCLTKKEIIDLLNLDPNLKIKKKILMNILSGIDEELIVPEKMALLYYKAELPKQEQGWLSDTHIKKLILQNIKDPSAFGGVFYIDHFYKKPKLLEGLKDGTGLIFNTSKKGFPGKHWVSVYIDKAYIYYFDPLGAAPGKSFLNNFLKKIGKPLIVNDERIQKDDGYCGDISSYQLINKINKKITKVTQEKAVNFTRIKNM